MAGDYGDYRDIIRARVLDQESFARATFSGALPGQSIPWIRVVIRPVLLKEKRFLQFSYFDSRKDITKNYSGDEAEEKLDELLALPFKNFHIDNTTRVVQINLSKKGKPLIRETGVEIPERKEVNLSHNREKELILDANKPEPFLQAVGIMTEEGKIKSERQSKFRQINEYLRLVEQTGVLEELRSGPVHVVDFGCGN